MAAAPAIRTPRAAGPALTAAAVALAVGVLAERLALDGPVWAPWLIAVDASVGVASILAGLAAWLARPDSRVGPALVAIGGLWFLGTFGYGTNADLIDFVGFPLQGWHDVLLVVLLLAVTPGGLREPAARWIAGGAFAAQSATALARLLLRPPLDVTSCLCVGNRITGVTDPGPYETAVRTASFASAGFAVAALVLIAVRWQRASGPARRTLAPLLGAGVAAAVLITSNRVATRVLSAPVDSSHGMLVAMAATRISIALAIVVSLVRGRRARTRVADVVMSLDDRGLAGGSAAMRQALADPSLRLLRWSPERRCHVDADGREVALPGPAAGSRPPCSNATASCSARWCTTPPCAKSPSSWLRSRRPRGSRSTTSGWPTTCARSSTRFRRRVSGSSPPAMPSAAGSSATCTTGRSSG